MSLFGKNKCQKAKEALKSQFGIDLYESGHYECDKWLEYSISILEKYDFVAVINRKEHGKFVAKEWYLYDQSSGWVKKASMDKRQSINLYAETMPYNMETVLEKYGNTLSTEILAAPADLKDWIRPAVACITTCITLLFSNDSLDRECALLCHKALLSIQGKTAHFKLDFVQLAGFFYSMFLLESSLGLPCQEQYLNQCLELIPNDALPFQMKAAFFQVAAAHFFQCGQLSRMEKYLKSALNEMTSVWQSYVRYLSDERLIQILSPTQNLFSLCYSLTRTDKEEGCERVLQFKHLASLAGKERNIILRSGAMDENLLHQIQNMQNHVAALASRALFRDENSEEEERAWDNLRQLEAEFSARFPENLTFTEITLEKVKKAIPNNSVVVEYFFAAVPSVEAQKHDLQLDPCLDIYIICKRNEQCAFFRETVPNSDSIVKTAEKFIDTLQAESGDNASISQVMSKETLRSSLFHSYLLRCEDRNSYTCYPSFRAIGKAVGLSRNTVQKYVSALEEKSLIETEKTSVFRKDGSKWNGNLKFSILPIQFALEFYNEQQALNTHSSPQKPL